MRTRASSGFTLIEVMLSLTVAGLAVTAAYAALGAVATVQERSRAAREPTLAGASARASLASWLASASLLENTEPFRSVDRADGSLQLDELDFAVMDGGPLRPGPHRLRLWIDRDRATPEQGLVAELRPIIGSRQRPAPQTLEIAPAASGLEARYLVRVEGKERWVDEWRSEIQLPRAIHLRVVSLSRVRLGGLAPEGGLPALLTVPLLVPVTLENW